ncbi:MAG: ArsA-related P-loop ATPase [Myxococcota bacterium]
MGLLDALPNVTFVTGKGGVGKTTVAEGLVAALAARGETPLLVEVGEPGDVLRSQPVAGVRRELITGEDALARAAETLFGSAFAARLVMGSFAIKRLARAAAAVRAFAVLDEVRERAEQGRRVVVDLPATGHGLGWLRAPGQRAVLARAGRAHDMADRVDRELLAPGRSAVVVVTLPEPLVLQETGELLQRLRELTRLPPPGVVINGVPALLPLPDAPGTVPAAIVREARRREAGRERRRQELAALAALAPGALVELPRFPAEPPPAEVARHLARGQAPVEVAAG